MTVNKLCRDQGATAEIVCMVVKTFLLEIYLRLVSYWILTVNSSTGLCRPTTSLHLAGSTAMTKASWAHFF